MLVKTPEQGNARMLQIMEETEPPDGIWYFAEIYQLSRVAVQLHVNMGTFEDPGYIRNLDVRFLNLFLSAYLNSKQEPQNIPVAWRPSFEHRLDEWKIPIQHMVAGLIAHIFRDLTLAVYELEPFWRALPNKAFATRRWRDYSRVSDIIVDTMNNDVLPRYRDTYNGDLLLGIDALLGGFSIRGARTDAWDRGNSMRLLHPLGGFLQSTQDQAYSAEAAVLAESFLAPDLGRLLPVG